MELNQERTEYCAVYQWPNDEGKWEERRMNFDDQLDALQWAASITKLTRYPIQVYALHYKVTAELLTEVQPC